MCQGRSDRLEDSDWDGVALGADDAVGIGFIVFVTGEILLVVLGLDLLHEVADVGFNGSIIVDALDWVEGLCWYAVVEEAYK